MFFVLSKILLFLTVPVTWIGACLAYGFYTKNKRRKKRAFWSAAIMFFIFSNQIIFDEFMRAWEVDGTKNEHVEHYDAAIVLGGMAYYNTDLERINFVRGSDRIFQALRLYERGKVDKIMICGDSGSLRDDGLDEAEQVKTYLLEIGVPEQDIIIENKSKNTHENAEFAADILKSGDYGDRFLLVTSGYHMRRALACFKAEGLDCTPYSTDHFTGERWFTLDRLFMPSIATLNNWKILTKEWLGYATYSIMGYL